MNPPHALVYILLWRYFDNLFYSWRISAHSLSSGSFGNKLSYYCSLIHSSSFHLFSSSSCTLLIIFHHHRLCHHFLFLFTTFCFNVISNILHLWIYKLTSQLSTLIIPFLKRNFFLPIIVLMADLAYHLQTSLVSLTSDHPNPPKSYHCIDSVIWFLYTLLSCLYRLSIS